MSDKSTAIEVSYDRSAHAMALEPTGITSAFQLSEMAVQSGMLPRGIDTPQKAMMVLMRGRELGLTAMQSFASINVISGKAALSAELMIALVKRRRDVCLYFRFVEGSDKAATFETHREGEPEPTRLTFTMEQARTLGLSDKDQWRKQPANMLRWRAATALARLVYPELTLGIYSTDEAEDIPSSQSTRMPPRMVDAQAPKVDKLHEQPAQSEEPIEAAMERWEAVLGEAETIDYCEKIAKEIAARIPNKADANRKQAGKWYAAARKRIVDEIAARAKAAAEKIGDTFPGTTIVERIVGEDDDQ